MVPGGAAAEDGRLHQGDEIIEISGKNVEGESHAMAVQLMQKAAASGHVKLVVRRPKTGGQFFMVLFHNAYTSLCFSSFRTDVQDVEFCLLFRFITFNLCSS